MGTEHEIFLPLVYSSQKTLKSSFGAHGIRFGLAVQSSSFRSDIMRPIIEREAAIVTTENALTMQSVQAVRGVYHFWEVDAILGYADKLGVGVHGHTTSWWGHNPTWLTRGGFSKAELATILREHISMISHHCYKRLISVDTANEGYLSAGPWYPLGTDDYIRISFEASKEPRPYPPVVYNSIFDTSWEQEKALVSLNSGLIDGIGVQLHLATTMDWEYALDQMDRFLDRMQRRGDWVRLSEVGVRQQNDGESEQQAIIYAAVARLAVRYSDIVRDLVVWGVIPPMWRGDVGLWDSNGNPKPSYYAVMEAL